MGTEQEGHASVGLRQHILSTKSWFNERKANTPIAPLLGTYFVVMMN